MYINHINNKIKIAIVAIPILSLLVIGFIGANAGTFTCATNVCTGSDGFTIGDSSGLFHFTLSGFDGITIKESGMINAATKLIIKDAIRFADSGSFRTAIIKVLDKIVFGDFTSTLSSVISTTTILITETITKILNSCSGSSCYVNPNAGNMEALAEQIIFPLIFIMGTVFGFLYMGLKFFGVSVMIATFILIGLAYIGIIPSYFTLLSIIAVGAALTKMISGMIGDKGTE